MHGTPGADEQSRQLIAGTLIIEWEGSYSHVFQRCLNLLGVMDVELVDADPNHGFLAARCGPSLRGLGVNVRIDFETHLERTTVRIQSTPRLALLDWGAAEGFLARFKGAWDRMPEPAPELPDPSHAASRQEPIPSE